MYLSLHNQDNNNKARYNKVKLPKQIVAKQAKKIKILLKKLTNKSRIAFNNNSHPHKVRFRKYYLKRNNTSSQSNKLAKFHKVILKSSNNNNKMLAQILDSYRIRIVPRFRTKAIYNNNKILDKKQDNSLKQ